MVTRDDLIERADEVTHLIKWWVSRSKLRYHRVRKHGTTGDFISDVWVRMLSNLKDQKEVDCSLATIVLNSCQWEIVCPKRLGTKRTWEARERIRQAEDVQSYHRIENYDGEQLVEFVSNKELKNIIAELLRSLTWRQAVIVRARLGLLGDKEMTLEEIGSLLKIGRERVRQIELQGLKKLQDHTREDKLRPFYAEQIETVRRKVSVKKRQQLLKTEYGRVLLEELTKG